MTMVMVTHCTSKARPFQGKMLMRELSCPEVWRDPIGCPARCGPRDSTPGTTELVDERKWQPMQAPALPLGSNVLRVAIDILIRMSLPFESAGCRFYIYLFAPAHRLWPPMSAGTLVLLIVTCLWLSTKPGEKDSFGESLWDGRMNKVSSFQPLFAGSSLLPFIGLGPCSLQVSPKSSCPSVSFSSWKRKFILKAAPLFVLLVIPSWMGPICCMFGRSSHSVFLWYVTFPFRPRVAWCSGKPHCT